jgi:hypothetical protein
VGTLNFGAKYGILQTGADHEVSNNIFCGGMGTNGSIIADMSYAGILSGTIADCGKYQPLIP